MIKRLHNNTSKPTRVDVATHFYGSLGKDGIKMKIP